MQEAVVFLDNSAVAKSMTQTAEPTDNTGESARYHGQGKKLVDWGFCAAEYIFTGLGIYVTDSSRHLTKWLSALLVWISTIYLVS